MKIICFLLGTMMLFSQTKPDTLDLKLNTSRVILDKKINENSGLDYNSGYVWTFNDSGGKPKLYLLDPNSGAIMKTIKITNVKNQDWEAVTSDGKNIYVGEFGNNKGMRQNLKVFKFPIPNLNVNDSIIKVVADSIEFAFKNQTDFGDNGWRVSNFDCESMAYHNSKLHIFTKEWGSYKTTHYMLDTIPNQPKQELEPIESFPVGCVITDAVIKDNQLHMVGYTKEGITKYWQFNKIKDNKMFTSKNKEFILGFAPEIGQIEGITVDTENNKVYISGEEISVAEMSCPQVMYTLPLK